MKNIIHHKIVRTLLKIVLWVFGIFVILGIAVHVYISANKDNILAGINERLSERLHGDVKIEDLKVNIWLHFPKVKVSLTGLEISDSAYHRPAVKIEEVYTDLWLFDVIGRKVNINSVTLRNGEINFFTDSLGYSNKYLTKFKKDKSSDKNKKKFLVEEVILENINVKLENAQKNKRHEVRFITAYATMKEGLDSVLNIRLKEHALIKGLGFNLEKGAFLKDKTIDAVWNLSYKPQTGELSFPMTAATIDSQLFKIQGSFFLLDSTNAHFKLMVDAKQVNFQRTRELMTENIQKKIRTVTLAKPFDVAATLEGQLAYKAIPKVAINWTVDNNVLNTGIAEFDSCQFVGNFTNEKLPGIPRTDDNSEVLIQKFIGKWGGIDLHADKIIVSNLKTPFMKFDFSSECDFADLDDKFGLNTLRFLKGKARLDLLYDGPLITDFKLFENLNGILKFKDGVVRYDPRDITFTNCEGEIVFSSNDLSVKMLECNVGQNHFKVSLSGKDISKLSNSTGGKASITCTVSTPSLNLGDFRSLFDAPRHISPKKSKQKLARTAMQIDEALENGSLQLNVKAGDVKLDRFTAKYVEGGILFNNDNWDIQKVYIQHADGTLLLKGNIDQSDVNRHKANISFNANNVDVNKLFYAFDNFGQDGVTYKNIRGRITASAKIATIIDKKGNLIPESVNGTVFFSLKNGALVNHEGVQKMKSFVFKDKDLSNIRFGELKDSLVIKNGEFYIKRMEIRSSVISMYLEGVYSLRDNTDISIQVPLSNFFKKADEMPLENQGTKAKTGASIYLRAKSDSRGNIKIGLDIFKKLRKNKVKDKLGSD